MGTDHEFVDMWNEARNKLGPQLFSLFRNDTCVSNPIIPDSALFEQVHEDTGYADADPDVQSSQAGMDESAALLANRTDCEYDGELNFDALLLGGYFCHLCLPEQDSICDFGGTCSNVQWLGYVCDNEFLVEQDDEGAIVIMTTNGTIIDPAGLLLATDVMYRFTMLGDHTLCASTPDNPNLVCGSKGPLLLSVDDLSTTSLRFSVDGEAAFEISIDGTVAPSVSAANVFEPSITSSPSPGPVTETTTSAPTSGTRGPLIPAVFACA